MGLKYAYATNIDMSAECSLPLTVIDGKSIKLDTNRNGKTPYAKISYVDSSFILDPLSIVTPSLPILHYDFNRGRIDIDLSTDDISYAKFKMLQDTLLSLLHTHQYEWFNTNSSTLDIVTERFQPFLQGTVLSIYVSTVLRSGKPIWVFKQGIWSNTLKSTTLEVGKSVRLVLKLTGIQSYYNLGMQISPKNLKCHIVMHPIAVLLKD
jgi:hypothetical protein